MAAPAENSRLRRVIMKEIMLGRRNGKAARHVALIFGAQRVADALSQSQNKDAPAGIGA